MKRILLRIRWCKDCNTIYKTYSKYSHYCINCYILRIKKIKPALLKRIYPEEYLGFLSTEKIKIIDDKYINKRELIIEGGV